MSSITFLPDDLTARIFCLADTPLPVVRSLSRKYPSSHAINLIAIELIKKIAKFLKRDHKSFIPENKSEIDTIREIFKQQHQKLCDFSKKTYLDWRKKQQLIPGSFQYYIALEEWMEITKAQAYVSLFIRLPYSEEYKKSFLSKEPDLILQARKIKGFIESPNQDLTHVTEIERHISPHSRLENKPLRYIPDEVNAFINLKKISLEQDELSSLTCSIYSLTNLNSLNLRKNALCSLSQETSNLANLTMLNLGRNNFSKLPSSSASLTQLRELTLSDNQFSEIPSVCFCFTQLTLLFLCNNHFTKITDEIQILTGLTNLSLMQNELTELPDTMTRLTGLTTLYLNSNRFTDLPRLCEKLPKLTSFHFDNNPTPALLEIKKFPYLTGIYRATCATHRIFIDTYRYYLLMQLKFEDCLKVLETFNSFPENTKKAFMDENFSKLSVYEKAETIKRVFNIK